MLNKISIIFSTSIIVILVLLAFYYESKPSANNNISKTADVSLYSSQSEKICKMLNSALSKYKLGNSDLAYSLADSAYWDVYDNLLEIKYRSFGTPAEIFATENKFHSISSAMQTKFTGDRYNASKNNIQQLCSIIKKQAAVLNKNI